jgi:hypothetical protein
MGANATTPDFDHRRSSWITIVVTIIVLILAYMGISFCVQHFVMQSDDVPYGNLVINLSATSTNISDIEQITIYAYDKNGNPVLEPDCFIRRDQALTLQDKIVSLPLFGLTKYFGWYQGVELIGIKGCSHSEAAARQGNTFYMNFIPHNGASEDLQTTINSFNVNQPIDVYAAQCGLVVDMSAHGSC